jgi:hypothetical protein
MYATSAFGEAVSVAMTMTFDKVPDWVAWLAQDADGTWHPKGQAVAVKPLKP